MRIASFTLIMVMSASAIASDNEPARQHDKTPGAHPEACYTTSSPDLRNLCRARATGDASTCYTITDLRAYCRATTGSY